MRGGKHPQNAAIEGYVFNSGILPLYRVEAVPSDFDAAKPDVPLFRAPLYRATYCNVLLLDHVKRAKVKGYLRYQRDICQGHFHILITMHHHINAARISTSIFLPSLMIKYFSSGLGNLWL